jgi:hypothetical protein
MKSLVLILMELLGYSQHIRKLPISITGILMDTPFHQLALSVLLWILLALRVPACKFNALAKILRLSMNSGYSILLAAYVAWGHRNETRKNRIQSHLPARTVGGITQLSMEALTLRYE